MLSTHRDRGIERRLLDAAIAHARDLRFEVIDVDVGEADVAQRNLLSEAGLSHVRTHVHLRRDSAEPADGTMPDREFVKIATRDDVVRLTDIQNAAFTGSWGYCPNIPEEIEYRVFDLPQDGPDVVLLLYRAASLVAYCWTHSEAPGEPGVVGMVGVEPSLQGQGIGRAATAAGINHLVETGATPIDVTVDSQNTPAVRLYESLGFELQWKSLWYELRLA